MTPPNRVASGVILEAEKALLEAIFERNGIAF
jgi:hypothetical protein